MQVELSLNCTDKIILGIPLSTSCVFVVNLFLF